MSRSSLLSSFGHPISNQQILPQTLGGGMKGDCGSCWWLWWYFDLVGGGDRLRYWFVVVVVVVVGDGGESGGCRCWRKREVKNSYEREVKGKKEVRLKKIRPLKLDISCSPDIQFTLIKYDYTKYLYLNNNIIYLIITNNLLSPHHHFFSFFEKNSSCFKIWENP